MELGALEELLREQGVEARVPVLVALASLAGREVELPAAELGAPLRRAVLLLAAGGDPARELDLDGRAVTALAADLETPERQADVALGAAALVPQAAGYPLLAGALAELAADPDLAWRAFAASLLADELGGEG